MRSSQIYLSFWKELSSRVLLKDKIHKSVVADKFGYGEHDILDYFNMLYCKSARGIYN